MSPKTKYTKEIIIDAAFDIAKEHGFAAVTARSVASKVQGSVAPIYVNFPTMEALLDAVIMKTTMIAETIISEVEDADLFAKIGKASLLFAKRYPILFRDMIWYGKTAQPTIDQQHSVFVDLLKDTKSFKMASKEAIEDLLLKVSIFQLGLSTMVANQRLPQHYDESKTEALLKEVGDVFYQSMIKENK